MSNITFGEFYNTLTKTINEHPEYKKYNIQLISPQINAKISNISIGKLLIPNGDVVFNMETNDYKNFEVIKIEQNFKKIIKEEASKSFESESKDDIITKTWLLPNMITRILNYAFGLAGLKSA